MNDQHINEFISYSQSTHLTVVVNSIAMAVLKLMHNYQDTLINPATIDLITGEDYLQCVAVLSTLTPDDFCKEDEDPVLFKDLQQNLPSVIEYIVTKSKSPIHDEFDKVSIFNGTDDEIICFPLSKILVLTVKALYDHQKFTHQYTGTEEERLIAATKDLPLRLLSMFKCVKKINKGISNTGFRNEIIMLLNGIYQDINIIENERATVEWFYKEKINQVIANLIATESLTREILTAVYEWMLDGNVINLLQLTDTHVETPLIEHFIQHGSNPHTLKIKDQGQRINLITFIQNMATSLPFASDNRILTIIYDLLNVNNALHNQDARNQSLCYIQDFISQDFNYSLAQNQFLESYYVVHNVYFELSQHMRVLVLTESVSEENLLQFILKCDEYYLQVVSAAKEDLPLPPAELINAIHKLQGLIIECKKENFYDLIDNFFKNFFISYNAQVFNNVYSLLVEDTVLTKIVLTDHLIELWLQQDLAGNAQVFNYFTSYQINRIFLHAIINSPEQWSLPFLHIFKQTLSFIKELSRQNFIGNEEQKNSYPDELIQQLDYLQSIAEGAPILRPNFMIILPSHRVHTIYDWLFLERELTYEKLCAVYQIQKSTINKLLFRYAIIDYPTLIDCPILPVLFPADRVDFLIEKICKNHLSKMSLNDAKITMDELYSTIFSASENNVTVAYYAAEQRYANVLRILYDLGVDFNQANHDGYTPVMIALDLRYVDILRILYDLGANLDAPENNDEGATPALVAASFGYVDVLRLFHELKIDLNQVMSNGAFLAYVAAQNGHVEVLSLLAELGVDIHRTGDLNSSIACIAAQNGHCNVLYKLRQLGFVEFDTPNDNGYTPLMFAVLQGHVDVLRVLHEIGVDLNKANNQGFTASSIAVSETTVDVLRVLGELGADLDKANINGDTPAIIAASIENVDALRVLHELGADLNKANNTGETPAIISASLGKLDVLMALHELGADLNQTNNLGQSPEESARINGYFRVARHIKRLRDNQVTIDDNVENQTTKSPRI